MTTPAREIWFRLENGADNDPPIIEFVRLQPNDATVADFRSQVLAKCPKALADTDASQLRVYRRKADLDAKKWMDARTKLTSDNKTDDEDLYWVVAPQPDHAAAGASPITDCTQIRTIIDNFLDGIRLTPKRAAFLDNPLEMKLDKSLTGSVQQQLKDAKSTQVMLAPSGAGKTRSLLEYLYRTPGCYFSLSTADKGDKEIGSADIDQCMRDASEMPMNVGKYVGYLAVSRLKILEWMVSKEFDSSQLLLAQLRPKHFFDNADVFLNLYLRMKDKNIGESALEASGLIQVCVIDEIQRSLGEAVYSNQPASATKRPFFAPLVRKMRVFFNNEKIAVAGTGIDYETVRGCLDSMVLKEGHSYELVQNFSQLADDQSISSYCKFILKDRGISDANIKAICEKLGAYKLCHGRPRFIAFILGNLLTVPATKVLNQFEKSIQHFEELFRRPNASLFPLRFLVENGWDYVKTITVGSFNLGHELCKASLQFQLTGNSPEHLSLACPQQLVGDLVRYGIGYADIRLDKWSVRIMEPAIPYCLRFVIPIDETFTTCIGLMKDEIKPQSVGYWVEYVVTLAVLANHGLSLAPTKQFTNIVDFLNEPLDKKTRCHVLFPENQCGPDIMIKFAIGNKVSLKIIQAKFYKSTTYMDIDKAVATTDPAKFYHYRSSKSGILPGYEATYSKIQPLLQLYDIERILFVHGKKIEPEKMIQPGKESTPRISLRSTTAASLTQQATSKATRKLRGSYTEPKPSVVTLVTPETKPLFFAAVEKDYSFKVWSILDGIREKLDPSSSSISAPKRKKLDLSAMSIDD